MIKAEYVKVKVVKDLTQITKEKTNSKKGELCLREWKPYFLLLFQNLFLKKYKKAGFKSQYGSAKY